MAKYIVRTPLSDGVDKDGKQKRIAPNKVIDRDPEDQDTIDLVACKAIELVPADDDGEGAKPAAKQSAKK